MKKLLALFAAVAFMTGFAGHALADEKNAEDKGKMEKPAEARKMPMAAAKNANGTVKMAAASSAATIPYRRTCSVSPWRIWIGP